MSNQIALPEVAQAIDREHQAATGAARIALEHAAECGRLLLEAKAALPHGGWLPWLETNTSVSARQSQRYMRHATSVLEGKYDATSHLTIEGALAAIAAPQKKDEPEQSWPEPELTGTLRLAPWPGGSGMGATVWVRDGEIEGIMCAKWPEDDTFETMRRAHEALNRMKKVGAEQWQAEEARAAGYY